MVQQEPSHAPQYLAALIVNMLAFSCGTAIAWPTTALPYLESPQSPILLTKEQSSWVASLICLAACLVSPFSGLLPDRIGRKKTCYLLGIFLIICWILIISATNVISLYIARIFSGLNTVGVFMIIPMFVVEIASINIRGILGTFVTFLCALGIAISYVLGSILTYENLLYVNLALPVLFILLFFWIPETPVYLIYSGKMEEAKKSLQWFRGKHYDITNEFNSIQASFDVNESDNTAPLTIKEIIYSKASLRGLMIVFILALNQQLSGIFPFLSYTVFIFKEAGSDLSPNVSTIIIGFIPIIGYIISVILVERAGRKVLLIISNSVAIICLICIGTYFYLKEIQVDVSNIGWLPVSSLSLFMVAYATGVGPMLYTVLSEVVTSRLRYIANTICQFTVWAMAFLLTKFFNNISESIGTYSTFWIFAVCCFLAMLFIIFQLPETKGKSLDEIRDLLEGKRMKLINRNCELSNVENKY